jgi:tripartite-type tricarboxylate transporter receptor subunit TctC
VSRDVCKRVVSIIEIFFWRTKIMKKVLAITVALLLCASVSFAEFPERDITDVVVWGAGGGTDTCNRVIAAEMAKILGVNINVINKTGGVAGSIGMTYAFSQPSDGYTLCGLSESNVTSAVQEGWDQKMDVWDFLIVGGSPDIVSVTPDAPYAGIEELIEDAKANPEKVKACASGAGSIHHLNLLALMEGSGAQFSFIPYPGSAPCQDAAMKGEVTVVVTSLAEQQQLIKGGKLRALGMLIPDAFELDGVGEIPSSFDAYPELAAHLPISQAIGMAVKADTPDEIKEVLYDAFKKALETDAVQKWAKESYYLLSGATGEEAKAIFNSLESKFAWKLFELGAAKVNPEELGIPKP